ncbi:hypothetical protein DS909_00020 [Phaeobacter gallaeciensis]|uniref:Uncharacterized protein n=1 Tax=Phaeobacter gallaeciensis TaxID=60890 RepID=A0A366XAT0_9RHOB|nr:hypothetical protein DS909_00020 [Phaeobacter gallaeciensis]
MTFVAFVGFVALVIFLAGYALVALVAFVAFVVIVIKGRGRDFIAFVALVILVAFIVLIAFVPFIGKADRTKQIDILQHSFQKNFEFAFRKVGHEDLQNMLTCNGPIVRKFC